MDWQFVLVLTFIALASVYVVRAAYGAVTSPGGRCASGCGKCAVPPVESVPSRRVTLQQVSRS